MPWNPKEIMSIKEELIMKALLHHQTVTELSQEFGICRKTIYKWLKRYKAEGMEGLVDKSKRPYTSPSKIKSDLVDLILETKSKYLAWGSRKLRQVLINEGHKDLPSESTFNRILLKHGKIEEEESKKRQRFIRFEHLNPNDLWQMDFKGHFRVEEGRCHPLTVIDDHSRFVVCLKACLKEDEASVRGALEDVFRAYGLPKAMTMDNGSPWRGSPCRFSRFTIWLMRLGIKVSHSTPRHPQTQGKDERFHRTIKEEVLKYNQFKKLAQVQTGFDEWLTIYNYKRPHEGIGLLRPADRYIPSPRLYQGVTPIEYGQDDKIRKVRSCGQIGFQGKDYFIGEHLYGEYVALRQVEEHMWDIYFVNTRVGRIKLKE